MTTQDSDQWLSEITLRKVFSMLSDNGVKEVLYKILPRNANSKNQVYLGGEDPSQFAKLPTGEMTAHVSVSQKSGKQEAVFRARLDFYWLTETGQLAPAPHAKMIFYPQYPEVRFSGFLKGCPDAPSSLWTRERRGTEPGRILILGVGNQSKVVGLTLPPEAPATKEILASAPHPAYGVLSILSMPGRQAVDGLDELMMRLCHIHQMGWVKSKRLATDGSVVPCEAPNCNGNTLEALLDIRSNGLSEPDFMGWEIKARQVRDSEKPNNSVVTLFTPEPTIGVYTEGIEAFVRRFGYTDRLGRPDRLNFGGIHRATHSHHTRTGLQLVLDGFCPETLKYLPTGSLLLVDRKGEVAAGWPFSKLMDRWKKKHAHAAYVPAQQLRTPFRQYRYGKTVLLCEGAEFKLLLDAFHKGKAYYDPGIKLEGVSTSTPRWKQRSQFRVNSRDLPTLYAESKLVDVCSEVARRGLPSCLP
jgi:hypothetical protein